MIQHNETISDGLITYDVNITVYIYKYQATTERIIYIYL